MKHHRRAFGLGVLLTLGCVVGYSQLDKILMAGGRALGVRVFPPGAPLRLAGGRNAG
jgi:hypothetical protein